jgi:hypothetical protein
MKIQVLGVAVLLGLAGTLGCGTSKRQSDAVNSAANSSCDAYSRCNNIGPGQKYATRSDCEIDNKAFWNNQWPSATCDNKINQDKLQFCLNAIAGTSCDNFLDSLNTTYLKCPESDVCSG